MLDCIRDKGVTIYVEADLIVEFFGDNYLGDENTSDENLVDGNRSEDPNYDIIEVSDTKNGMNESNFSSEDEEKAASAPSASWKNPKIGAT
ncbi:conserved hypothetical protein [Ricinus communis]|uniref:Uncharacterized protein n=1 Tax=Ricinus communis TaxID=3988 RepID=B9SLU8_RICCO|nr:conserved hypothetical protein [Ricinus communis]